jgi:hypothetical protein
MGKELVVRSETAPRHRWRRNPRSFAALQKVWLGLRILYWFTIVSRRVKRHPLPVAVVSLCRRSTSGRDEIDPDRLGRAVGRVLRPFGPVRARCLIKSLTLLAMLPQGDSAIHLVIGLPSRPSSQEAHAWVEIDGVDVGPPPGRDSHQELIRYP